MFEDIRQLFGLDLFINRWVQGGDPQKGRSPAVAMVTGAGTSTTQSPVDRGG